MRSTIRFFFLVFCLKTFPGFAQNTPQSSMLENSLSAVVTVAVYEVEFGKRSMGFRGNPADLAYTKMLDLTGALSSGSGFVIKHGQEVYVITNAHVVEQAADKEGSIYVYSINRTKYKTKIVGGDSFYDLAVLEFLDNPGKEVSTMEFRTEPAHVGEKVFAIGNPLGEYPYTVTDGIISAKNRVRGGLTGKFGFLQTTATVIWGNSGGPLIDESGKVLGINSQIAFANQGNTSIWQPQINFALEAPLANRLVNELLDNGIVKRAFIGVEMIQRKLAYDWNTKEYAYYSRIYEEDQRPVIASVLANSPADALRPYVGSKIISINKEATRNLEEVLGKLEEVKPGDQVEFVVEKDGVQHTVQVVSKPLDEQASSTMGNVLTSKMKAVYSKDNKSITLNFSGQEKAMGIAVKNTGNTSQNLTGDWQVLGVGLYVEGHESMWRVVNLADVGTALRLTGLTGVVDLALFRKGSDPNADDNYKLKRVNLSSNEHLIQPTLWY